MLLLPLSASGISTGAGGDNSWNWQNPLPQGNDILAQSWINTTTGWAVGRNGVLLKTTDSGTTWVHQDSAISSDQRNQVDLRGVAFADANTGWIAGGTALVKKTTDGGSTWTTATLPADFTGYAVNGIAAYDSQRVVVVGASGRVAYTINGGSTWLTPTTNPARTAGTTLNGVSFRNATNAYAVGAGGLIMMTANNGTTWATQTSGVTYTLNAVSFASGTTVGYVVGNSTGSAWTVLRTTGGTTWAAIGSQENTALYGVSVLDANNCVLVGAKGSAWKTSTASAGTPTWSNVALPQMKDAGLSARSVKLIDTTHVAAAGDGGSMPYSSDAALTWVAPSATAKANIMASWFSDATHGWMCGTNGAIQRTTDGGVTWTRSVVGTGTWRTIYFTSNTNGYVAGDGGALRTTTDGGVNWTTRTSGVTTQINSICFSTVTPATGYFVTSNGLMRYTTDSGVSWTNRATGTTSALYGVYPVSTTNVFAVGAGGVIRRVYNNGFFWTNAAVGSVPSTVTLNAIRGSGTYLWTVGTGGRFYRSTDSGGTWTAMTSGTTRDLYSLSFLSTTLGLVGGANGTLKIANGTTVTSATVTGLPSDTSVAIRGLSYPAAASAYYAPDSGIVRKSTDGGDNWLSGQESVYGQLNAVDFSDSTHGWAAGNDGQIHATVDGGTTWTRQPSGTSSHLNGISFGSNAVGYAVGAGGGVRKTTDGGATWAAQSSGVSTQLNGIAASTSNPNYAITVGASGAIRYTTNGGSLWTAATTVPALSATDNMLAVSYVSTSSTEIACIAVGHAAGNGHPSILRTTDHGQTWTAVASMNQPPSAVSFAPTPSSGIGWASAAAGFVYKTVDGGLSWTSQTTPITTAFTGVSAVTSQSAFAVGSTGVIAQTANGGTTWLTQNSGFGSTGASQHLLATEFTDANHGFAVGTGGAILRTVNQTPPATAVTLNPSVPDGSEGWYRTIVPQVTLTPDQTSQTYYSWAAATGPFTSYSSALSPTEGARTLYFYSVNASNRAEPVQSAAVNSDLTPPSTPTNMLGAPIDSTSAQLSWNPSTDSGSAIDHYELWRRIGAGTPTRVTTTSPIVTNAMATELTANTTYSFWVVAYDHAGNVSANSAVVDVSTTALGPLSTAAAVVPASPNGLNEWYITTPTVSFTVAPSEPAYTHFAWDGSDLETYTVPVQMPHVGAHTLSFWSEDQAGLRVQELPSSQVLRLDTTSPSAPIVTASGASTSSLEISWTEATDGQSGVDHYELWVGGAPRGTYTGTEAVVEGLDVNRDYSVYVVTFNTAGLTSISTSVIGHTLANPAVSTSAARTPATPDGLNGWYITAPTVALTSLPANVPCWGHYSWNGGAETTYTAAIGVPSDGAHTLSYYSVDQADATNVETPAQTMTIRQDTADPSPPTTVVPQSVDATTIVVDWTVGSDATSGMDHYALYVDGVFSRTVAGTSAEVTGLIASRLYSFAVASVDVAGNESAQSTPVYAGTSASPALVTSAASTPAAPDGSNGWYLTTPTVTFSVTPPIAADTRYAWDTSALATATGPITMPVAGTHTLSYWSIDQAGERAQEATRQLTFLLDRTVPVASTLSASALSTTSLLVSWTPSYDAESGIDYYELFVDGAPYGTYAGMSTIVGGFFANTPHQLVVRTHNVAGMTADSAMVIGTTAANSAVSTLYAVSPAAPDGANGWYVTAPAVTLTSTPTALPAWTYRWWDASASETYTVPVSLASQGVHDLHFYSVDQADTSNREATRTLSLSFDSGVPSPPIGVNTLTLGTGSIGVDWTLGADAVSGVDRYQLYVDGAFHSSVTATGTTVSGFAPNSLHTFAVVTVDEAGNVSAQSPTVFGVTAMDGAMSTTAQASPAAPDGANGWYITNPAITLTSSPATVAADTNYAWDASALASYTVPVSAPSDGQHTLSFWSVDEAGERAQEPTQQVIYRVDTSAPSQPTGVSANAASTTSLLVDWTAATDTHSAIDHYEVWVDGTMRGTTTSTESTVTGLAVNRSYPVHVVAVNTAGLTATTADITGTTAANAAVSTTCTVAPVAPNGANGWYVTTPTVTLATLPSDLPAWAYYGWDSSAVTTYTAPFTPPAEGVHELGYHSVDQADSLNRDATSTLTVRLDTVVPAPPTTLSAAAATTSSVSISWSAGSDLTSGVDHYIVYVNGAPWGSVSGMSTTVPGLIPNSFYTFTVATVDTAGNVSAESPSIIEATVALAPLETTPVVAPVVPDGLNDWYVTTPTVTFSVAPAIPAWTYYGWDGSAMTTVTGPIEPPSNGTHVLSYWSVDQAGEHAREATQQIILRQDALPDIRLTQDASPTIEATTTLVTDTEINLAWTPAPASASGLDHYEVWDDYLGSTTDTWYLVSGLEPMTVYPFKVYGVNAAGTYFSESETITVETSPPPLPAAPAIVYASAPGGGFVNVNWTPAKIRIGEMGYHVWRSEDAVNYSQIATVTGQYTNAYTDTGLSSSTRYWYVVSTFDDRGESSMSDSSTAVWPYMAPTTGGAERPTGLTATEGSATVLLSWAPDVNPAVTGYHVTRADISLGAETTITPVQVPATITPSFLDTTVTNGQTYYYRVYPVDASSTVGMGSLEKQAVPRAVLSTDTPNPHVVSAAPSSNCQKCHSLHTAPADAELLQYVAGGPNEVRTCFLCHSPNTAQASTDTSSQVSSPLNRSSIDMWLPTSTEPTPTMTCIDCHRTLVAQEASPTAGLLAAGGTGMTRDDATALTGDTVCYTCHGASSVLPYGDMSGFESSAHFGVASPPSGSEVKCVTCHDTHASRNTSMTRYEGYMGCVQCHSAASTNPNEPDVWTSLTEGEDANTRHSLLPADQSNGSSMSCQNCHNTHMTTAANPVVDPHDPSSAGTWTGNLDGNTRDFCFRCHDGDPLPTSAETTPWAGAVLGEEATTTAVDIEAAYNLNVHGFATSSNPTTATAMLRTDMGYAVGDTLDCTACHDSHGTTNDFSLLPEVKSQDGESSVSGLLVYKIPAGTITPTSPVGYDLRFFCSSCHVYDVKSHDERALTDTTEFGKTDCTTCHSHVGPNAVFGNGM